MRERGREGGEDEVDASPLVERGEGEGVRFSLRGSAKVEGRHPRLTGVQIRLRGKRKKTN